MGNSLFLDKARNAGFALKKRKEVADYLSNGDRKWDGRHRDRLPLGVCVLIWLVLGGVSWCSIFWLGMFIFS